MTTSGTTQGFEITQSSTILYEKKNGTAWITLNRPERMNALSFDLRGAMSKALREAVRDEEVMVVIITGAGGRAFCAGNDLKDAADRYAQGIQAGTEVGPSDNYGVRECPKPTIAAIDGYAVAGGMELSMGCDIRIATEKSMFGLPEIKRGRMAGPGLTELGRMIPLGEAKMIQLTGSHMNAKRAYDIGYIQGITPDRESLFAEVERLAEDIQSNAPLSIEATKRVINIAHLMPPEYIQKVWNPERAIIDRSEDIVEGSTAFAQKRKPIWKRR